MIITIEGADNTGKTTLAEYLAQYFNFEYVKFSTPKSMEEAKKEYFAIIDSKKNMVLDRSWIGEFVYGPLLRDYQPDYWKELEEKLSKKKVLNILLHSPKPLLRENQTADSILSQHQTVSELFINIFNKIKSGEKIIFNIENFRSLAQELVKITDFVKRWKDNETAYLPFDNFYTFTLFNPRFRFINGVMRIPEECNCEFFEEHKEYDFYKNYKSITWGAGNLNAKIMFVGEAPGFKGCGKLGIPFYNDKSGMLLREAMFKSKLLETEIYITNVLKCNPKDNKINGRNISECGKHLKNEINLVQPKRIITLGNTATKFLEQMKIPHESWKHPAWAIYKHKEKEYIESFKRNING